MDDFFGQAELEPELAHFVFEKLSSGSISLNLIPGRPPTL